ncbi:MAG TPA: hypothetical protein VF519_04115 [Mycobacteriales bacterium]|jgi:hypothetical protein
MSRQRTFARCVTALAVVAAPLAVAAPARAENATELRITIGPAPGASVTPTLGGAPGTAALVGTVRGVLEGEALDLRDCAVSPDLTTGTVTLQRCAGSDAVVTVDPLTGPGDSGGGSLAIARQPVVLFIGTWCEWVEYYGAWIFDCWFRIITSE